ncbi:MAG: HAD family hydrolase [Desulfurococcus sp.]|nr:HAD family hydrolase [Desulfurococcus sp.]
MVHPALLGVKLVLFDLDGTLVDSEDFIVWSFTEAGRLTGIQVDPELVREMIGYPLESLVRVILGGVSEEKLREFTEVRRRLVSENWFKRVRVYPDVPPVLEYLSSNGFTLGVASSSVRERLELFLEYFGLTRFFKTISGVEPGVRGKPEPDVLLRALKATGVDSSEAVYIGDRIVDCIAAKRARVRSVLVDRGWLKNKGECTPDYTIPSLLALINN